MFLGNNFISWSVKKQATVARSSTETKFYILADATTKLVWTQNLLKEIGFPKLLCF